MRIGIPRPTGEHERRVPLVPADAGRLRRGGWQVAIESGAGEPAGFSDQEYQAQGAELLDEPGAAWSSDVVVSISIADDPPAPANAVLVGQCDALGRPERLLHYAGKGLTVFGLEMMPRITRAQSMDVLSSMATLAGYRAVLLAAVELPRIFPLLMTAAGTLSPARVFVIGAGVAGLQAIATARRLGATVRGYDVRPAAAEQIESLGAKAVVLQMESEQVEDKGGYAKALGEEFYRRQRELLAQVVAESHVVITTAAVPGKRAPVLIDEQAVRGMPPGSVIVDLAAERGGNCECTQPGTITEVAGVKVIGYTDLAGQVPYHASQMFSRNIANFLLHVSRQGELLLDLEDEITRETLLVHQRDVVHARLRELLGLAPLSGGTAPEGHAAPGGTDAGNSNNANSANDPKRANDANSQ